MGLGSSRGQLWKDPARADRNRDEGSDERESDEGARIPAQDRPGVAPEPARRFELDLSGFELDDGHQLSRIRGLMIAYETSTSRFTSTKTTARKRMPPCRTG